MEPNMDWNIETDDGVWIELKSLPVNAKGFKSAVLTVGTTIVVHLKTVNMESATIWIVF